MRRKVSLISRESNTPTLDFRLLEQELTGRGIEVETLTKLLTKTASLDKLTYIGHMLKQIKSIATSRVLVLDTYCIAASMLPHRRTLKTIQIWHALSAVKQFGWQTVGKPDGTSPRVARLMRMHRGYDYVTCASDVTAGYFCEAFDVTPDKIVKLGLPRIDYILADDSEMNAAIYAKYPRLQSCRKNILYAPTFHKGSPVDVAGLANAIDTDKYNLIIKLHPIDSESSEHIEREGVIYDDCFSTYDMLRVSDIVISDYSSLVVEVSLTDKPLYLYVYDEASYRETTGLNMNFADESIGRYAFGDAEALAAELERPYDYEALRSFRSKYIDINTVNCTKQLADFIEGLL